MGIRKLRKTEPAVVVGTGTAQAKKKKAALVKKIQEKKEKAVTGRRTRKTAAVHKQEVVGKPVNDKVLPSPTIA